MMKVLPTNLPSPFKTFRHGVKGVFPPTFFITVFHTDFEQAPVRCESFQNQNNEGE